jgi:hypothetical protein
VEKPVLETAHQIHASSARLRLRVPSRRHDAAWFSAVRSTLGAQATITEVRADPMRGVLTLGLRGAVGTDPAARAALLAAAGICIALPGPERRLPPSAALRGLRPDRRTLAWGLFLLLLTRHLLRSGWLAPGLALLWLLWESFPALRRSVPGMGSGQRRH